MAVIEAKKTSIDSRQAEGQALAYAKQLGVPFIFLSNGSEVWFWDYQREAHPHDVKTFFGQDDLERRIAILATRVDPLTVPVDTKIAGRDYQLECIETLCRETGAGRRKLLVEMATGTGKTRGSKRSPTLWSSMPEQRSPKLPEASISKHPPHPSAGPG